MLLSLEKIIGLQVVAVRGYKSRKNQISHIKAEYICFSDKKTFIELNKQDYHQYHDCSYSAREFYVQQDAGAWMRIMNDKTGVFANATEDW